MVVIRSRAQLDYSGVAAALAGDFRGRRERYREHIEHVARLDSVAGALRRRRRRRGSLLDLDLPEATVVLDDDDPSRVRDITVQKHEPGVREAYNLVEELMIAANEAVGALFIAAESPTIWRAHAPPRESSLERLAMHLANYGINVEPQKLVKPKAMAKLLRELGDHSASRSLSYLVLRSLSQAVYQVEHQGHFGLASQAYLHFTSPIRRYPDLHVHRLIKQLLRSQGRPSGGELRLRMRGQEQLSRVARESSGAERRALEVERAVRAIYSAALMRDRIGDEFDGVVIGLTSFGVFVGVQRPFVEGMVRHESLPEPVEYDAERVRLFGRRSGKALSLGDALKVQLVSANTTRRQIEFEVTEWDLAPRRSKQGKDRGRRRTKSREQLRGELNARTRRRPGRRR